jgi:hypothetical protein
MYLFTYSGPIPEYILSTVARLQSIDPGSWSLKPDLTWSKKEILGHLIDSAQNNIRRLIVSQYQENDRIVYHQDEWVHYARYQAMEVNDIILLWKLLNEQYHRIASALSAEALRRTCNTGNDAVQIVSLDFLINDYWGHQEHHLNQILLN